MLATQKPSIARLTRTPAPRLVHQVDRAAAVNVHEVDVRADLVLQELGGADHRVRLIACHLGEIC